MDGSVTPVALVCRTADRGPGAAGAAELAQRLGARVIGTPGEPRETRYDEDLRDARGCLLEAGGQVDDALAAGHVPLLLAGDCSVSLTTLAAVFRHRPDAHVLWLDAHGDFNTPDTSPSGYLGGMCLAGACGRWDTGLADPIDPARVIQYGVRDLDGGERVELATAGVNRIDHPGFVAGLPLYVHLDLDVLDPGVHAAQFPVPDGLSSMRLRLFLGEVVRSAEIVGVEVTSHWPGHAALVEEVLAPVLAGRGDEE